MGKYTLDFTASEINERLGKLNDIPISMELLWENASPTSEFAEQTIELDLTEYNHLIVSVKLLYNGGEAYAYAFMKKDGSQTPLIYANGSDRGVQIRYRNAMAYNTGVTFSQAYYAHGATAEIVANGVAIPIEIYGIKGVQ